MRLLTFKQNGGEVQRQGNQSINNGHEGAGSEK